MQYSAAMRITLAPRFQQLLNAGHLDKAEHHTFKSFWDSAQANGPHAGLTNVRSALPPSHRHGDDAVPASQASVGIPRCNAATMLPRRRLTEVDSC
jgi:hypothetical protein